MLAAHGWFGYTPQMHIQGARGHECGWGAGGSKHWFLS
jgi:hypothetical protein